MTKLNDTYWPEMAKAAGNLGMESRAAVEEALQNCRLDGEPGFHFIGDEARRTVIKARRQLGHLRRSLACLDSRLDFRRYNAAINADTSLAKELENLESLDSRLSNDEVRMSKRNRKGLQSREIGILCIELLEIRSFDLGIDVPTQATETTQSGRFHKYLEMALRLVAEHANAQERAEMLKRGIDAAVKSFQARKADPMYSHQWEYLFPQTEMALMKSRKFRNG
jgi:hypothetical protein